MTTPMKFSFKSFSLLLLSLLLFFTTSVSLEIPRRWSPTTYLRRNYWVQRHRSSKSSSLFDGGDYQTFYYNQTLDHFNFRPQSFNTFKQRYVINSKHWGGSNKNAPIFAYLGAEDAIDSDVINTIVPEYALRFRALQIYIEHRYYGKSIPFGSRKEAYKNGSTLGYFNSAQALADYSEILIHVKKQLNAEDCPIIVFGASYGGMLASWFRLKYPHVTHGALASSAPILYFDNIVPPQSGYYEVVSKSFRDMSESCYQIIKKSWYEIDRIAAKRKGLGKLSKIFRTCRPLTKKDDLKNYFDSLYTGAAQYNSPPDYPVTQICRGIDGASTIDDIMTKIFKGMVAFEGHKLCYVNPPYKKTETDIGWQWQSCSDMVQPIGINNNTMFQPDPFKINQYIKDCNAQYGVPPRPRWVTEYYGGHDIKMILRKFASNIIFANGLRDPYSIGGVLENISDSVIAIHTNNGSHCLDINPSDPADPDWLVKQRKVEVRIIKRWIANYYAELKAFKG